VCDWYRLGKIPNKLNMIEPKKDLETAEKIVEAVNKTTNDYDAIEKTTIILKSYLNKVRNERADKSKGN
jgi:hypothetical protein|tara:strand:- start:107 stop:313 length:207 start_codon:yes stop_codon:yes gene_type:complete